MSSSPLSSSAIPAPSSARVSLINDCQEARKRLILFRLILYEIGKQERKGADFCAQIGPLLMLCVMLQ
ncbi:MAG TPA: hypothetical protein VGM01_00400 [Ktedonobacteraceae bacterium]